MMFIILHHKYRDKKLDQQTKEQKNGGASNGFPNRRITFYRDAFYFFSDLFLLFLYISIPSYDYQTSVLPISDERSIMVRRASDDRKTVMITVQNTKYQWNKA